MNKIEVKFRTNNALENYNKRFKEMNDMNPNMQTSIFIDNITNDILHHVETIRILENKNPHKNKNNTKCKIIKKNEIETNEELNDSSLNELINDILNEYNGKIRRRKNKKIFYQS